MIAVGKIWGTREKRAPGKECLWRQQIPDQHQQQDMGRVEDVKQMLQEPGFDKPPLAVVQIDGNKGRKGEELAGKQGIGGDGLGCGLFPQQVHEEYQNGARQAVAGAQHLGGHADQRHEGKYLAFAGNGFVGIDHQKSQKQGEIHVLGIGVEKGLAYHEIVGQFRDQGEYQQPQGVTLFVPGVQEALGDQKTENREGDPAEFAHDIIPCQFVAENFKGHKQPAEHRREDQGRMIDQHADNSQQLEHTAAEDPKLVEGKGVFQNSHLRW